MTNNKGITLIALVITIIVLLILAGVSIAMLTGNNGILTKANDASDSTTKAAIAEKVNVAIQAAYTNHVVAGKTGVLPVADIVTQYNADNGASAATGSATPITVVENGKNYSVELVQTGNSYTTSVDKVSLAD